ncbi:MAG: asparagine synthase-related protein [Gemmatimonadota bacterium]|nr:asparagine synthase-related protein [Gemmatimonadota bacterium]
MSGIVGIINLDGEPIDQGLLRRMTDFMTYRGPDAQGVWSDGQVGFGHTWLRTTTDDSPGERQPCSLNGNVWITADARVDGRAELIRELAAAGRADTKVATDAELILHAYHAWGEECLQHLLGDFAFAIWDGPKRRLFCARDHIGVKMFYYARVGDTLVFSNTIDCVRCHPGVSDRLNEQTIGDFLLFGFNKDTASTPFADIHFLPPAHSLTGSPEGVQTRRYWALPLDAEVRYRRDRDYLDHFRELFRAATGDRLRTDRVGVLMSGGLDSPLVAATARQVLTERAASFDLRAYTGVYDRLIPDQERYYSGLVAQALGIPIHHHVLDDYELYERWNQPELCTPQLSSGNMAAAHVDLFHQIGTYCRVALTGYDGDAVLTAHPRPYFRSLFRRRRFVRLITEMVPYVLSPSRLPGRIRTRLKRRSVSMPESVYGTTFPAWINQAFASRTGLRARWEEACNPPPAPESAERAYSHRILTSPGWSVLFEAYDPGVTRLPLEFRHPLIDLRVVEYLLSLPPVPWCVNKHLFRMALRGVVPDAVVRRPKTPVVGDPLRERLRRPGAEWINQLDAVPALSNYVDVHALPRPAGEHVQGADLWMKLLPRGLNHYLWHLTCRRKRCTLPQ